MVKTNLLSSIVLLAWCQPVSAQLSAPNQAGVAMGHLHLNTKDPEAQKKFWVEGLSATPAKLASLEGVRIPGAIILFRKAEPSGGTDESVVGHVGVKVSDLKGTTAKATAAGAKILTQNERQVMLLAPDAIKVELTEDKSLAVPVANHHIHFYSAPVGETQAWYGKMFGAKPGKRGPFDAADVPGVNLTFSPAEHALAPTKGRSLDHIGFEIADLEQFCKKLGEAGVKLDVPFRKVPQLGISIAFLTDPWGTNIELTEGLDQATKP